MSTTAEGKPVEFAEYVWLGQSGFLLRGSGCTVVVDAFLTEMPERTVAPPISADTLTDVDVILCTHEHIDHFDAPTVRAIAHASPHAIVVVPQPILDQTEQLGIDAARIVGAVDGEVVPGLPDGVRVTALPAEHGSHMTDAYWLGKADGGPARFLSYVIELGGVRTFHAGDTLWWDGMAEALRSHDVQVALLPINGADKLREAKDLVGNMDARDAATLAGEAGVDLVVPMHWDVFSFNQGFPDHLVAAVERLGLDVNVLVPRRMRPFRYISG